MLNPEELTTLSLTNIAHYHQRPGTQPRPGILVEGMRCIELITGGSGAVWNGDDWQPVEPGTLLWHYPGDLTIGRSDESNPYRCLAVRYHTPQPDQRRVPRFSQWHDREAVLDFTREAVRLFVDERFDHRVLAQYVVGRLYYQVMLDHWLGQRRSLPPPLQRVVAVIESRFTDPLPMDALAKEAGWSVPHLHEVFRHHLGKTPHQYLVACRLRAACERLVSTSQPIKAIALECGFASVSLFCATFRRVYDQTPATYRRERLL
jgi:AraC-like DNA-binding protein